MKNLNKNTRITRQNILRPKFHDENNSLNYCKLKFEVDTLNNKIRRLRNNHYGFQSIDDYLRYDSLRYEIEKELEISIEYLPTSEIHQYITDRIKHIISQ